MLKLLFTLLRSVWAFIHANNRFYRPVQCNMPLLLASFRRHRHQSGQSAVQTTTVQLQSTSTMVHNHTAHFETDFVYIHTQTRTAPKPVAKHKIGCFRL